MKTILKPWGKEEWIELNDRYCYKRIYINAGYKTSYQYHLYKKETNYIISGVAEVWLENDEGVVETIIMKAGDYFNVLPPKKHRVIALTDIILQEVSTPEVDDVIRIEDDTNRKDGKIEGEHKKPAVLILAAGLGTRLEKLTTYVNKALLPLNNRAIISKIIESFPSDYDFVIAVGYKSQSLKEYCKIAFPSHSITFVDIDNIEGPDSGPGYSALKCQSLLQRPFYITTCDCLVDTPIPYLDGNWLGVYPTAIPEKYSTLDMSETADILSLRNKSTNGYDYAFIGLASIWDYEVFWNELRENMTGGELVTAFQSPNKYPILKGKNLKWFDVGNLDDLNHALNYFTDKSLSLSKSNGEIVYKENDTFIKFIPNKQKLANLSKRANSLYHYIPKNVVCTENFIYYDWQNGSTLYELDELEVYKNFLDTLEVAVSNGKIDTSKDSIDNIRIFYVDKTQSRMQNFLTNTSQKYFETQFTINGKRYPSLKNLFERIDFSSLEKNPFYELFHGDLQFDNIVYDRANNCYTYIDWRDCFGSSTRGGDVYYDLAKLYGGCLIPYHKMKDENNISFLEGTSNVNFTYEVSDNLNKFKSIYENWIVKNGFSLDKVKLITGLIFINMSPLHDEKFGKMLWFKSIETLYECLHK